MSFSLSVSAQTTELLVSSDYNDSTEGYGTSKFSNYASAYAYATANAKNATIVIEKTTTLSGNTFDNNHKNYSKLAVVIKDGKTKVAANVTATNSTIDVDELTVNSGRTLNLNEGSTLEAENITLAGTAKVKVDGNEASVEDGVLIIPVADFAALKAAVEAGKSVKLTADITTTAAITTSGVTSVIDLNDKTLTIGAGDNKFNDASDITIKNGTISITGVTVGGNGVFCLDEYEKTLKTTLTLENVNLVGNGYSSAYCIFYIGDLSVLNVKGGEWSLKNDASTAGGVFKSDASAATLNIDGLKLTAHNVRRVVTYAATTIANSTLAISGDADGVDAEMEHGFNRSPLAISNSTITMTDMVGRGITAQNGAVTISENSTVTMTNCQEATIDVRNNQTVTIDSSSTVSVDKEPTITSGTISGTVKLPAVAKIGETEYSDFAAALTAASAMSGDVTIEVYDKVTLNTAFSGSYSSINFVGKDTDAEIYLDVQGYITATGKKVSFTDLKLSKSAGGFITNAGFMNVAFGIYDVVEVAYTNCVFANGAYASSGNVIFNGCTFYRSHDKYGLWAYGNVDATVEGCTFADYRGIKMYAEDKTKTTDLTVKSCDFSAVTDKPAIVLTYGESVVLEDNTYSSTGTFELDLDGAPNGTAVTSDVAPTCKNDNGACGVLVDGKIYTTVAQAAEVATGSSTVTLLHSSTETVLLPEGSTLVLNGFTAPNVTVEVSLAGEGTEASPYLISNKKELLWFQAKVDELATDGSTQFAGKYFKLTADIDLNNENWNPIGSMSGDHGSFKGVFDGGDHTISNLKVEQAGNGIGLFARTTGNAVIKNLKLNNVSVKSTNNSNYAGAVVGNAYASTKIENVHVSGNVLVSGRGYIGGIAGHGYVVMDNVSVVATGDGQGNNKGLITSTFWCAGGILGYAGEGATNIMNANVENVVVTSAAGGLGAIVGMAEDNNGTQPISGSNLSAKNVEIKTYIGDFGDAYANYALGYLYGGNPTSKLTGELSVENVTLATSNGVDPTPVDAVAKVNNAIYFSLTEAIAAAQTGDVVKVFEGTYAVPTMKAGITIEGVGNVLLEGTLSGTLENLTLKNLHIKGGNAQRYAYAKGNLVFENVTFEATSVYALHFDGITEGTTLLYKDCTIIGWAAMGGSPASCVFDGCTIKDNGTYGVIRTYFDATIKNCRFDVANANTGDVYQDGIHAVGGAKIVVNGCTNVNGKMKDLVNVSDASVVTVDGVEFKNVAKIGETYYETLDAAFAAAQDNDEVKIIAAGTYALTTSGKNITITGAVEGVVFDNIGAKNMGSANVTFNNVTFDYYPNVNYTGLQHSGNLTYNDCIINGQVFLYGQSETFNKCTFNQNSADAYNVWTYGAKDVDFNECTFNSVGKSVLVYNESTTATNDVAFTNCVLKASAAVEGKAAIEIDTSLSAGATITVDGATTATGFGSGNVSGNSLWNNKKGSNTDANNDITVVVNNETVLAPVTFVAKIGETGYKTLAEAFAAADDDDTVTLLKDITYTKETGSINGGYVDGLVYTGDKNFTVDFARHTVTENGDINDYLVYLKNTGEKDNEITFKNGTIAINSQSTATAWAAITVGSGSSTHATTLNLEGMKVINGNPNAAANQVIRSRNGATVNLNEGTLVTSNGTSYGVVAEATATVNINDGAKVVHTNSKTTGGNQVYTAVSGNGTINVYDGAEIVSDNYGIHNMTTGNAVINIYGGTITAPVIVHAATNGGSGESADVYISGGRFFGAMEEYTNNANIHVSNGEFDRPVFDRPVAEEFCAEDYAPCDNADGTYGVYYAVLDEVHFVDGEFTEYNNSRNMTVGTLTYKRYAVSTGWNQLYVPFEVPVSELADQGFEVAYINGVRRGDDNYDGELDDFVMEVIYIHGGNADGSEKTLKANYPYFIRYNGEDGNSSKDLIIELEDVMLYAAKNATFDCTTFTEKFEITGTTKTVKATDFEDGYSNKYGVNAKTGKWKVFGETATMRPFRFYMAVTSREDNSPIVSIASMSIVVRGEELPDGTTLIYDINAETGDNVIYDLNGRRVLETEKGNIYIINGKKVLVK